MVFTPQRLVMIVFMMHAIVLTNWLARIPDMQVKLGVTVGQLSLDLLGASIGTFVALLFAGRIVARLTARQTIRVVFALYAVAFALVGWAWNVSSLFVILFIAGFFLPIVDVASNVEANRIETSIGRRIMSTCHGFWSVGSIIGGLMGTAFASLQIDIRWHLLAVAVVTIPIVFVVATQLPRQVAKTTDQQKVGIALPTLSLLPLCIFAFGMRLVESAALNWTNSFMRTVLETPPLEAGIGFAAFAVTMAVGRFFGDWATGRFGPVMVARVCSLIALAGVIALITAPVFAQAIIGLAAMGIGVSVAIPLSVSAAASRSDRPAAVNVAALSLVSFTGFMIEPPLVGFGTDWGGGLRIGLAFVIPAAIAAVVLAGHVRRTFRTKPSSAEVA